MLGGHGAGGEEQQREIAHGLTSPARARWIHGKAVEACGMLKLLRDGE